MNLKYIMVSGTKTDTKNSIIYMIPFYDTFKKTTLLREIYKSVITGEKG